MGKALVGGVRLALTLLLVVFSFLTAVIINRTVECFFCRPLLGFDHPSHVPPGKRFNATGYTSFVTLLEAHRSWQQQALALIKQHTLGGIRKTKPPDLPPVVLVKLPTNGLGNRLPSVATGLMMALLSGRLFMVEQDAAFASQVQLTWDSVWQHHSNLYTNSSRCTVDLNAFAAPSRAWCPSGPHDAVVMSYHSIDYDMPVLQLSQSYRSNIQHLVPSGTVFHEVAKHLFAPTPEVLRATEPYGPLAEQCLVGVHIRSKKPFPGSPKAYVDLQQFAGVAGALAQSRPGNIFLAADTVLFDQFKQLFPQRVVWWNNVTQSTLATTKSAGRNPGSDLSAMADILLLARCKHIVITAGSSFGALAAAWGGRHAVHVTRGSHEQPFYSPWFWVSLTSEPCMFKVSRFWGQSLNSTMRQALREHHPLFLYYEQCN